MNAPAVRVRRPVVDRPTPPKAAVSAGAPDAAKVEAVAAPWWHKIKLLGEDGQPLDFKQGGWNMRTNGLTTMGLVRVSDGKWVLPPIKCKEYMQDAMYAKHVGKDLAAYGYTARAEDFKDQKLALVFGVPTVLDFVAPTVWALERGIKTFQMLTGNVFEKPTVTATGRTFKTAVWTIGGTSAEQDMILVEYDERIENHPALFSVFLTCLRAGSYYAAPDVIRPSGGYGSLVVGLAPSWWQGQFTLEQADQFDRTQLASNLQDTIADTALLAEQAIKYSASLVYAHVATVVGPSSWHTVSGLGGFSTVTMLYKGEAK